MVHMPSKETVQEAVESSSLSTIITFCDVGKLLFSVASAACAVVIACAR
jgi:hypothetical protein